MFYAYKSTLVPDKPASDDELSPYRDKHLVLPTLEGTVNGVKVTFKVDTGTGFTALGPADIASTNASSLPTASTTSITTANGPVTENLVLVKMTLQGSAEFDTAITLGKTLPFSVVSMSDVVKVFNVEFSQEGGVVFTPLSRPFKQQQQEQTVKKSRLGWSSGWI